MSKHTPGPWWVEVDENVQPGPYSWPIIVSEHYEVVGTEGLFGNFDTDMANASLIAAAPDLLEALEDLERMSGLPHIYEDPVRVRARAAIAKAKGEEK